MKIITSAQFSRFSRRQGTLYVPDDLATAPTPQEANGLIKAGSTIIKSAGAGGIAAGAWKLSTVPATTDHKALTDWLINNNIPPDKASPYASDLRQLLSNPAVRAVLFGVCGGAATYFVVEKTSWSPRTKWLATALGAVTSAATYLVLRHFEILT
jgi:hypothetical protein